MLARCTPEAPLIVCLSFLGHLSINAATAKIRLVQVGRKSSLCLQLTFRRRATPPYRVRGLVGRVEAFDADRILGSDVQV